MKELSTLTVDDLRAVPIWAIIKKGGGEFVGPTQLRTYPTDDTGPISQFNLIVYSEFIAANGARFHGYCCPSNSLGRGSTFPTIIGSHGRIGFSVDEFPAVSLIESELGWSTESLFPMTVRTLVPGKDGTVYSETIEMQSGDTGIHQQGF